MTASKHRQTLWIKRLRPFFTFLCLLIFAMAAAAQAQYDKRPITNLTVTLSGGTQTDMQAIEEYRLIAREAVGDMYSSPKIRDAIEALYNTKRVDMITV